MSRNKQSKLTKAARGRECQIRLPGCCDSDTVVLAHYRMAGDGMGTKPNDLRGAWACMHCHTIIDTHRSDFTRLAHAEGVFRTQMILINEGAIKI